MPDVRGALLLATALTLLTLALVQGNDWGWTSLAVLGALVGSVALGVGFVASSRAHPQPLLDPALLRISPFVVGNVVTAIAGAGFYAYMLTNILWLQYVWGYDILVAGLALVPGAVVAAVAAARLGPLAQKYGYRRILVPGALCWAAAYAWYAFAVGTTPSFWGEWMPGQVLSGLGVGATLPLLGSAALAAVPGGRFATASAVLSSTRHLGGALGIALLVVMIGTPTPANASDVLRNGWIFCVVTFALAAVGSLFLREASPVNEDDVEGGVALSAAAVHIPEQVGNGRASDVSLPLAPSRHDTYFGRLPAKVREHLETAGEQRSLPAGDWLFRAGEPADAMYVVLTGRLDVIVGDAVVREVGSGAVLGELALLTGGVRSASVRARRDTSLMAVSHDDFVAAMAGDPEAPMAVAAALAEQLASPPAAAEASSSQPVVVSVVGLSEGAPVAEVADTVTQGLARHLRVLASSGLTSEGLARAERDNDRVVLSAPQGRDPAAQEWRESALRQGDRLVLVARSDEAPPAQWVGSAQPDLVLVGPVPSADEVARWSAVVEPWQVTLVDEDGIRSGLDSLVARLAGRALGVVMAGGGARALAHLGVLHELEAAGIKVERTAGCSIGSIVAALHAMGYDAATAEAICYEEFVRRQPFSDYTVPTSALAKGRRKGEALRRRLGNDTRIEALPHQFRCVSTDLLSRQQHVHRSGVLWEAVAASARLPVLFPPLRSAGTLLVDGGVLDNLPVGVLAERDEGPILAVNIGMGGGSPSASANGSSRPVRIPALGETLLRTMMIGSGGAVERARATGAFVISPPSLGVGLLEFHQLDRMVESGRMSARALLEATGGDLTSPRHG